MLYIVNITIMLSSLLTLYSTQIYNGKYSNITCTNKLAAKRPLSSSTVYFNPHQSEVSQVIRRNLCQDFNVKKVVKYTNHFITGFPDHQHQDL